MPLSRWFSGGRPRLKDRVVKGLQQARDGDVDGAIETIAERFHDALSELQARQPPQDSGWLRLAEMALAGVPDEFQAKMSNTMIVVDDLPDLDAVREGEDPDLLGLYEGATVLEHGLPERIVLYQRNHENVAADERELEREVQETMRHEIGHHFGMEEDELPY